jgi:membrane protein YqaA with SNARE-associated domain
MIEAGGLLGLFLVALAAGSIFAAPSEAALVGVLLGGAAPALAVGVATAGNLLGAITVFAIGRGVRRGLGAWLERRLSPSSPSARARLSRAKALIERRGAAVLLLSWVPVAGDALVLAAGVAKVRWAGFLLFTALGKAGRYVAVAWLALQAR